MAQASGSKGSKIFNDPVHGSIEMPELCVWIIDTPQFQRLRNVKQLGGCYFVYPGASHNRFEHSIGTAHLAGCLVEGLKTRQPELKISDKDVLCVKIAGLCHDLGHGPFSHLFDGSFIPKALKGTEKETWKHEQASLDMFDTIFESIMENNSENPELDDTDATFIKELIDGPKGTEANKEEWPYKGRGEEKGFLYEIISNKESGVDVDKWDYFARDCHHLGMKNSFDHVRCIKMARVIEKDGKKHICFRDKQALDIYEMFHLRANLHRRAYQHKTSNAIEHMITDALLKADEHIRFEGKDGKQLKMSEAIGDMDAYTKLTDQVFYQILHSSDPDPDSDLNVAKAILQRIESRDLYTLIGEHTAKEKIPCKDEEKTKILQKANVEDVTEDDIILDPVKFDYGRKEKDPVKNVYFYKKDEEDKAFKFEEDHQFSYMLPANFVEWKIRLYLRKKLEKDKTDQLKKGFEAWFKETDGADADGGAAASDGADADGGAAASDGADADGGAAANDGADADGGAAANDGADADGGAAASGGADADGGAAASDGADKAGANREDATPEKSPDAGSRDGGTAKKKLEFSSGEKQ